MNPIEFLEKIDPKTVPKVPFQDKIIYARIEEIYDGDTVKIIILLGDVAVKLSLRILGIDTPEIKNGEGRLPEEQIKRHSLFISLVLKTEFLRLNI